jgi:hypothetical protein
MTTSQQLTPGTVVVAKHPVYRGAWWGTITAIDGENAAVLFKLDKSATPARLPVAILLAPVMPHCYENDGVGEHYWRKHCEVEAELLAFRHDPANEGKVFWPETMVD